MRHEDLSQKSMIDLFRIEAADHVQTLTSGLLALEREPAAPAQLESCMRAAHSLKGAARIVGIDAGVKVAHAMEDCFVGAQEQRIKLHQGHIDVLLQGIDLLQQIARTPEQELGRWDGERAGQIALFVQELQRVPLSAPEAAQSTATVAAPSERGPSVAQVAPQDKDRAAGPRDGQGMLRVTTENLNRLLGLA